MYFQTLENLRLEFNNNTDLNSDRRMEFVSAINKLDFWLAAIGRRQSEQINPLQFAENEKVTWGIATRLFQILTEKQFFAAYYRYWNDLTGDVLITTTSRKEISSRSTIFDNDLEESVPIDSDLIETVFKLLERTTKRSNFNVAEIVPRYSPATLKKDNRAKGAVDPGDF